MPSPTANIRARDRHRGIRAVLGFIRSDSVAIDDVLRETAEDETPGAIAALILALTEQAATYTSAAPDAETQLEAMLMEYAQEEADLG